MSNILKDTVLCEVCCASIVRGAVKKLPSAPDRYICVDCLDILEVTPEIIVDAGESHKAWIESLKSSSDSVFPEKVEK